MRILASIAAVLALILTILTGYASVLALQTSPPIVLRPDTRPPMERNLRAESTRYVASTRGKKYYVAGSPAAQRLSPKNLIFFTSAQEAEAAGFRR